MALEATRRAFAAVTEIRRTHLGGKWLQLPKIPPVLSESIVAREVLSDHSPFFGTPESVERGGKDADLIVTLGKEEFSVEVKTTGRQGFSYLYEKDILSPYLAWLSLGDDLEGGTLYPPMLHWVKDPRVCFSGPRKITLPVFLRLASGHVQSHSVSLSVRRI